MILVHWVRLCRKGQGLFKIEAHDYELHPECSLTHTVTHNSSVALDGAQPKESLNRPWLLSIVSFSK